MKRSMRAFVFINVTPVGKVEDVTKKLLRFDEVKEVHMITGEKDLIAVLEVERELLARSSKKVLDFVVKKIANIDNVKRTETIIPTYSITK
jgi:DNA-binding Lrp family transcriptional regulator